MCSRNRSEGQDQRYKSRAGSKGISQQSQGNIPPSQALTHDPGAHDRRQQQGGSYSFGHSSPQECSW